MVVILPLVLTRLTTSEIALWYCISTILVLQMLADMGFSATFSRVLAYAMSGATEIQDYRDATTHESIAAQPNWTLVSRIYSTMSHIYLWLAAGWVFLLATGGAWAVGALVNKAEHPTFAWIAWGMVVAVSAIRVYGSKYVSYLWGLNEVALVRRWEIVTGALSIVASFAVLIFHGGLLSLVVVTQGAGLLSVVILRHLARRVEGGRLDAEESKVLDRAILYAVWPSVWRSGIGVLMGAGLFQGTGIIYARLGSPDDVASYLLALNLMNVVAQFSQAPFYSKLPLLARLRAEGQLEKQVWLAQRGMRLSFWTLVIGILGIGILGPTTLVVLQANAKFVDPILWAVLGIAVFLERYGAMHIQLYSTTNHITWHIANGVTGLIYFSLVFMSFGILGMYAFPIGQLIANATFYSWYSARHSYAAFRLDFWDFEVRTSAAPLMILLLYAITTSIADPMKLSLKTGSYSIEFTARNPKPEPFLKLRTTSILRFQLRYCM
jgi:O-antigen/teichoic acid export membrane protein